MKTKQKTKQMKRNYKKYSIDKNNFYQKRSTKSNLL